MEKVKVEQMIKAVENSQGVILTAAKRLGVARSTMNRYVEKYPTVKAAVDSERETMKDFAESKLFQHINDGNVTSLIFFLKTQAYKRGYVERVRLEGNVDISIVNKAIQAIKDMNQEPADVFNELIRIAQEQE